MGIHLQKLGTFCLVAKMHLVPGISTPRIVFFIFSTINAHHHNYRSHLAGFCSFVCNFISPHSFTRGCIKDFNWTGVCRHIDITNWLICIKMLIYMKPCVVAPSSLFTVKTVTKVILTLVAPLRLTSFSWPLQKPQTWFAWRPSSDVSNLQLYGTIILLARLTKVRRWMCVKARLLSQASRYCEVAELPHHCLSAGLLLLMQDWAFLCKCLVLDRPNTSDSTRSDRYSPWNS